MRKEEQPYIEKIPKPIESTWKQKLCEAAFEESQPVEDGCVIVNVDKALPQKGNA